MLRQDCSAGVRKATAEHPPGRAWEDRHQQIPPGLAEQQGQPGTSPAPVAPQLWQPHPHQQTCLLRHRLASSWMEKSLCSRLCSASLAKQGCLRALQATKVLAWDAGAGLMSPVPREGQRMGCHPSPRRGHFITGTPLHTRPRHRDFLGIPAPTLSLPIFTISQRSTISFATSKDIQSTSSS